MKKLILLIFSFISLVLAKEVYILCEGNFGSSNASLWQYDGTETNGPVYWDLASNPLGDVAQSLTYHDNKLFVVVNNSHKVDVLNTETNELITSIELPYSTPRYMAIHGETGYLSCWGAAGIIRFDLNSYAVLDTIKVGALPEDLLIKDDVLYTSITMDAAWSSENNIYSYDLTTAMPTLIDSFEVIAGPAKMVLKGNDLYIASTYYDDSWNTYAGMSKINLETKSISTADYGINFSFSDDLAVYNNAVYRAYGNGMVKIDDDCQYNEEDQVGAVNGPVYALKVHDNNIYMAYTDYVAPDTVTILDSEANLVTHLKVGAIPGDFAFLPGSTDIEENTQLADKFELKQNYPNPFNPVTDIQYTLAQKTRVKLSVYNMLGQHITTLVNQSQTPGLKTIQWNAVDSHGNKVPTGVYFYRLEIMGESFVRKMVYMK